MSYACQSCGKHTRVHDTRDNIRVRRCTANHRLKSIELPYDAYLAEQTELAYLRALREAVQPQLDAFALELLEKPFVPEPNAHRNRRLTSRFMKNVTWESSKNRFIVRVHYKKVRITLYKGPDLFEAACLILSWKNKHDYRL